MQLFEQANHYISYCRKSSYFLRSSWSYIDTSLWILTHFVLIKVSSSKSYTLSHNKITVNYGPPPPKKNYGKENWHPGLTTPMFWKIILRGSSYCPPPPQSLKTYIVYKVNIQGSHTLLVLDNEWWLQKQIPITLTYVENESISSITVIDLLQSGWHGFAAADIQGSTVAFWYRACMVN